MARLIIGSGEEARDFALTEATSTIGRAPENTIQIEEASVSGRHARLLRDGEEFRFVDLGSTNGTRVNGETVKDVILRAGDVVRFGQIEARFECEVVAMASASALEEIVAPPIEMAVAAPGGPHFLPRPPQDSLAKISYAVAGVALLAFLVALVAIFTLHAPL